MAAHTQMVDIFRGNICVPYSLRDLPPLPGSLRSSNRQYWYVPLTPEVMEYFVDAPMTDKARMALRSLWIRFRDHMISLKKLNKKHTVDFSKYKFQPRAHQADCIERLLDVRRAPIWADCGLGKTYMMIVLFNELKPSRPGAKMLVVCPLALIEEVWAAETEKFSDLKVFNLNEQESYSITGEDGKKKYRKRYRKVDMNCDIYVINYEIIVKREQELKDLGFDMMVWDESSKLKNKESKRWKSAYNMSKDAARVYVMSGSPAPNGPKDLWAQHYIIDDGMTMGTDFSYMLRTTHTRFEVSKTREVWSSTAPGARWIRERNQLASLRYRSENCMDMPMRNNQVLHCELTTEQRRVYKELKKEYVAYLQGDVVKAKTTLSMRAKFQQITGGFVNAKEGIKEFKKNPKLDLLLELVQSIGQKTIVWSWLRHEIEMLSASLKEAGYSVEYIYGGLGTQKIRDRLNSFRTKGDILVANPASIGHGITLKEINYAIYYSNASDFDLRFQSERRIWGRGETQASFFYDLVAKDSIDEKVLDGCHSKDGMMKYLLNPEV